MNYTPFMEQEIVKLEQQLQQLEQWMRGAPAGHLEYQKVDDRVKWYHSLGRERHYIPAGSKPFAESLALKTYFSRLQQQYEAELKAAQSYLRSLKGAPRRSAAQMLANGNYRNLLSGKLPGLDALAWANAPYPQSPDHPEQKTIRAACGIYVRSKSEAIICDTLYQNHIPFRYEWKMSLGNQVFYPDFTILLRQAARLIRWEHLGMMDDPDYLRKANWKMQYYHNHGLILMQDLIVTTETRDNPLDPYLVQELVRIFFLNDDRVTRW